MKWKTYNKLVRDNIPDIIKKNNAQPVYRKITNDFFFNILLKKKFWEEIKEFLKNPCEEELADILEVSDFLPENEKQISLEIVDIYVKDYNFNIKYIQELQEKKRKEKGSFNKRYLLSKVIEKI